MAMLLDSVAPLVKTISLGSAPIRSATCCSGKVHSQQNAAGPFSPDILLTRPR